MTEQAGGKQKGWLFKLENNDEVLLESDLSAEEVAKIMEELNGGQYIWNADMIISVRRVMFARRMVEGDKGSREAREKQAVEELVKTLEEGTK